MLYYIKKEQATTFVLEIFLISMIPLYFIIKTEKEPYE